MKYAIGIDLGGTSIKYAIVSSSGDILHYDVIPSCAEHSSEKVIQQLKKAIRELLHSASKSNICVRGIGIGTPGITDNSGRIIIGCAENIVGWENIPLSDILETEFSIPVIIDNDANLMGLGEYAFGAATNCSDVIFITVGTGIGGAIIINNQLFRGYKNRGTEIGHIPLIADGDKCACGSVGCLEVYASTSALVKKFLSGLSSPLDINSEEIDGKYIVDKFKNKNLWAKECLTKHCDSLGHGIAGLINIFSPQRVVIGGGISESGIFYLDLIKESITKYVMAPCAYNTEVFLAKLGNKAGILGAAFLAMRKMNCQ